MKDYVYMDMKMKHTGKKWMIYTPHGTLFGSANGVAGARRLIKADRLLKEKT